MNLEESKERNTGWFEGRKEKEIMPLYYNLKVIIKRKEFQGVSLLIERR